MSCTSCPDAPLAPLSYTLPDCPAGSPCEEFAYTDCTSYRGPHLPALGITNSMSLKAALVALNNILADAPAIHEYTITVTPQQKTTTVEYINNLGALVSKTVSSAQSPVTICAQQGTPAKLSGTGTLTSAGTVCSETTT